MTYAELLNATENAEKVLETTEAAAASAAAAAASAAAAAVAARQLCTGLKGQLAKTQEYQQQMMQQQGYSQPPIQQQGHMQLQVMHPQRQMHLQVMSQHAMQQQCYTPQQGYPPHPMQPPMHRVMQPPMQRVQRSGSFTKPCRNGDQCDNPGCSFRHQSGIKRCGLVSSPLEEDPPFQLAQLRAQLARLEATNPAAAASSPPAPSPESTGNAEQ